MKEKAKFILAIILMVSALLGVLWVMGQWVLLQFNTRYTIGVTTGASAMRSSSYVDYEYKVNGKRYSGYSHSHDRMKIPGGFYLVKYSEGFPGVSDMKIRYILEDTTSVIIPDNGWNEIPSIVTKEY
jgi:hypothetical protein